MMPRRLAIFGMLPPTLSELRTFEMRLLCQLHVFVQQVAADWHVHPEVCRKPALKQLCQPDD